MQHCLHQKYRIVFIKICSYKKFALILKTKTAPAIIMRWNFLWKDNECRFDQILKWSWIGIFNYVAVYSYLYTLLWLYRFFSFNLFSKIFCFILWKQVNSWTNRVEQWHSMGIMGNWNYFSSIHSRSISLLFMPSVHAKVFHGCRVTFVTPINRLSFNFGWLILFQDTSKV